MVLIIKTPADIVYEKIGNIFSKSLNKNICITTIEQEAISVWKETWELIDTALPNGDWNWGGLKRKNNKKFSKRYFNVALWHNTELCGLSLGHFSRSEKHLWVDFIEGSPVKDHSLKGYVLKIIIATNLEYAFVMKKKYLKLAEPVEGLIKTYEKMGFEYINTGLFHKKRPICRREILK